MNVSELAVALETRGLRVECQDGNRLRVSRPDLSIRTAETIKVIDDVALWSWGTSVPGTTVEGVAAMVDHVISGSYAQNSA